MPAATPPSDAELIASARAGDADAYRDLRARHVAAARRLVGRTGRSGARSDDVVDETFAVVGAALQRGEGPDIAFRTYLFSTLRPVMIPPVGSAGPTGAFASDPPAVAPGLAGAYESLPERWRAVLWYVDVEGAPPSAVQAHLGMSSTEVAALAYRAREGLREAYVATRSAAETSDECRMVHDRIEVLAVGALTAGERRRVERHVEACPNCARLSADLADLRGSLVRAVAPRYLGAAADAYLARVPPAQAPRPHPEPARRRRRPAGVVRVGVAAVIVFVAALVTWLVYAATGANIAEESAALAQASVEIDRPGVDHGPRAVNNAPAAPAVDVPTPPPAHTPTPAPAATTPSASADAPSSTGAAPAGSSTPPATTAPTSAPASPTAPVATSPVLPAPPVVAAPQPQAAAADLVVGVSGATHGSSNVTVVVTNGGPHAAAAPTVQLNLRRAARNLPSGCTTSQNQLTVSCSFGAVPSGRQGRVAIGVVDGTDVVQVRVLSITGDPAPANNVWSSASGGITIDRDLNGVS